MDTNIAEKLSDEQKMILQEFRGNVSDLLGPSHDDEYLLRWLKARKFDLRKSENMLREHMNFKKKFGVDKILTDFEIPEVFKKYAIYSHTGYDNEGCAVMCYSYGKTDYRGIVRSLDLTEHVKTYVHLIEDSLQVMKEENKKTGRNAKRIINIFDCEGLKINQLMDKRAARRSLDLMNMFQANYPEILKTCYLINVPQFFYLWYNFAKGMFDPDWIKTFKIFGTNGWQDQLLDEVGADALPAHLGGNITDSDGNSEFYKMHIEPPIVPESYYAINIGIPVTKDPTMKKVVVRERTYFNLSIQVKLPQHVIRWRFQTLHHDIRYGLFYVPDGVKQMAEFSLTSLRKSFRRRVRRNSWEGHELLLPLERIESHVFPEEGEFHCEKTGTYLLHFDNTFSWVTPKELYYKVEVHPASEVLFSM